MKPESTTPQLTESDVGEIEARANAASPSYCVDWEKGDHALLQAGGWRPANEEQPRTIANFDKDGGSNTEQSVTPWSPAITDDAWLFAQAMTVLLLIVIVVAGPIAQKLWRVISKRGK